MTVEFNKSNRYQNNYYVEKENGETIYFHANEKGALHANLEQACHQQTGHGTWTFNNEKSEVKADGEGVTLRSKCEDGWHEVKLSYDQGRKLVKAIEERTAIEKELEKSS